MTISEAQGNADLALKAYQDALSTGAQYSLSGSHSVTQHRLQELRREWQFWLRLTNRLKGYGHRYQPDFGGDSANANSAMEVPLS